MRLFHLVLCLAIPCFSDEAATLQPFKNRVNVGLDGHLIYERLFAYGFRLGTDWKLRTHMEGSRFVHFDQQPEVWLLTAAHCLSGKIASWENKFSFLGGAYDLYGIKFNSDIRKRFVFDERWALSPSVKIFQYIFDPNAFGEDWPPSRLANYADLKTELGLELEVYF